MSGHPGILKRKRKRALRSNNKRFYFLQHCASVSDNEAIFPGLGRGMQETIRVITVNGEEQVAYSGYIFTKKSK